MTTPQIVAAILILLGAAFLFFVFLLRTTAIIEFRRKWRDSLADTPEAITMYHRRMPSHSKMFWTFWKPIKDSAWIPADLRAAKYRADLDPDTRAKFDLWAKNGGKVGGSIN